MPAKREITKEDVKDKAKIDLDSEDIPDLHDLHGKHVWKCVEKEPNVGSKEIEKENDKPVPEGWKPSTAEEGIEEENIST